MHNSHQLSDLSPHNYNEELTSTAQTTHNSLFDDHAEILVVEVPGPSHPMITRSKDGIFKKKILTASLSPNPTNPNSVQEALMIPEWKKAMTYEHEALMKNQTWTLVPSNKQMKIVNNKWVFRIKYHVDGSIQRYKAHLVAKGFQQTPRVDFFETFSPVIKPCTIRVIFTLAVTHNWDI